MDTLTIEDNGVSVTVRPAVGSDDLQATSLHVVLLGHIAPEQNTSNIPNRLWMVVVRFTQMILQTTQVEGMEWISPYASDTEIAVAFDSVMLNPARRSLVEKWGEAIYKVNRPPADNPNSFASSETNQSAELLKDESEDA